MYRTLTHREGNIGATILLVLMCLNIYNQLWRLPNKACGWCGVENIRIALHLSENKSKITDSIHTSIATLPVNIPLFPLVNTYTKEELEWMGYSHSRTSKNREFRPVITLFEKLDLLTPWKNYVYYHRDKYSTTKTDRRSLENALRFPYVQEFERHRILKKENKVLIEKMYVGIRRPARKKGNM